MLQKHNYIIKQFLKETKNCTGIQVAVKNILYFIINS